MPETIEPQAVPPAGSSAWLCFWRYAPCIALAQSMFMTVIMASRNNVPVAIAFAVATLNSLGWLMASTKLEVEIDAKHA